MAAHRRRRNDRRRGLRHDRRPCQGHVDLRRGERLSGRDRVRAPGPRQDCRCRRDRRPVGQVGESPLAVVVASDPTLTAAEVIEFCTGKLAPFKAVKAVEFVTRTAPQCERKDSSNASSASSSWKPWHAEAWNSAPATSQEAVDRLDECHDLFHRDVRCGGHLAPAGPPSGRTLHTPRITTTAVKAASITARMQCSEITRPCR